MFGNKLIKYHYSDINLRAALSEGGAACGPRAASCPSMIYVHAWNILTHFMLTEKIPLFCLLALISKLCRVT